MISIVDDDASVREALEVLVQSLGYVAATFASAEDFLASGCVDETACLIIDVQMPGLSGIELRRRLTANGQVVPTIFMTGFPDKRTQAEALATGAIAFLSKPFREKSLIDCLETALKGS